MRVTIVHQNRHRKPNHPLSHNLEKMTCLNALEEKFGKVIRRSWWAIKVGKLGKGTRTAWWMKILFRSSTVVCYQARRYAWQSWTRQTLGRCVGRYELECSVWHVVTSGGSWYEIDKESHGWQRRSWTRTAKVERIPEAAPTRAYVLFVDIEAHSHTRGCPSSWHRMEERKTTQQRMSRMRQNDCGKNFDGKGKDECRDSVAETATEREGHTFFSCVFCQRTCPRLLSQFSRCIQPPSHALIPRTAWLKDHGTLFVFCLKTVTCHRAMS